jgi:hypothetical protein
MRSEGSAGELLVTVQSDGLWAIKEQGRKIAMRPVSHFIRGGRKGVIFEKLLT